MGREANIDLIQALEKQIEKGGGDVIKLKRDRNLLLNISTRVPPEILGHVFVWRLVQESPFQGLQKGSYNFLLVCHHWFEIASGTPELWSFWGNTFQDWKKRHHRSGTTPLDLVLDGFRCDPGVSFDKSLQDTVRSRVMQDTIRQAHLKSSDGGTLASIISSLTPGDGGGQNENIESIVWKHGGVPPVDISTFFARSHLPRLRSLDLYGNFWVSSWDRLVARTTLLTTLSLSIDKFTPSPTLTTSQLFSILTSNPNLRELKLSGATIPYDTHGSTLNVPLRDLNTLALTGSFHQILGLLRQLVLPERLDDMYLSGTDSTTEDISQSFALYMRDYFRRDSRFQDGLGVSFTSSHVFASISVGVVRSQTSVPVLEPPRVALTAYAPILGVLAEELEQPFADLIALVPRERVVFFNPGVHLRPSEQLFSMMPNIEMLCLSDMELSSGFLRPNPEGPRANTKLFPSLRSLCLEHVIYLNDNDWSHLMTYLAHQAADGQPISLEVIGDIPNGCPEIVDGIRGLVKEFTHHQGQG